MVDSSLSDWIQTTLGQFITLQRGIDLPTKDRRQGTVPILGSFGITGWHDEAKVEGPGITVGRSGASFGTVSYSSENYWPLNTALYVKDFHGNDPKYAYYFLKTFPFKLYNSGSAQPSLNRNFVHPVSIRVPPLPEQKRISAVLGALDDKIELNRKMNKTLEAMAQAIFKSWFVDFEPFRNGGMVDSLPAPNASARQAGELGPIPKGWKVGRVGDIASNYRQTVKPEEQEEGTPYIGLADMPMRCIALDSWGVAGDATSAKARYQSGDILFGKLRSYFKKVGVAPTDGVCSSDILVVRPKQEMWFGYTLGILTYDAFIDFTSTVSTGTRMPRVNWKAMSGYWVAIPPVEISEKFNVFVAALVKRIQSNILENRNLAELRNTLLPKLISGEIRVPEAEQMVAEVE